MKYVTVWAEILTKYDDLKQLGPYFVLPGRLDRALPLFAQQILLEHQCQEIEFWLKPRGMNRKSSHFLEHFINAG